MHIIRTSAFPLFPLFLAALLSAGCAATAVQPDEPVAAQEPIRTSPRIPAAVEEPVPATAMPRPGTAQPEPATKAPPQQSDLWDRIRAGFAFPPLRNRYVSYYENWYRARPEYLRRVVERATRYLYYIVEEVEQRGVPLEIALLPVIESAFKPNAYSRAHAGGLWQFIPATGRRYGLKQNWWYDGRRDVISATQAALDYLTFLHKEFHGDWFHALAAYNTGERRVARAIRYNRQRGRSTAYQHLRLKSETRRYVPKLIAVKNIVLNPERYGLTLQTIPNRPYFVSVDTRSQVDLSVAAELAAVSAQELKQLNAGFRRWATDPDGPHRLLVPVAHGQRLQQGLTQLPPGKRMRWARHQIRRGDTLSAIARRYGVSVRSIQRTNKLRGTRIRAGNTLLIPVSARAQTRGPKRRTASGKRRSSKPLVHRVRSGDTLWAIARRYNVYVSELRRWNAIETNHILQLGQKILVYRN